MQTLEPPEVPLELLPEITIPEQKKEGFFKRLFSKKSDTSDVDSSDVPLPSYLNNNTLNENLPSLELSKNTFYNPKNVNVLDNKNSEKYTPPDLSLSDFELPEDINKIDPSESSSIDSAFAKAQLSLPSIDEELVSSDITDTSNTKVSKGFAKGKLKKGKLKHIKKIDESSQFDWTREVKDQEILIHDSNRSNQDINVLITETDKYLNDKTSANNNNSLFTSQHQDIILPPEDLIVPKFEPIIKPLPKENISDDLLQMPTLDEEEHEAFSKISMSHDKLKSTLERYLTNKKLFNNKPKVIALFRHYDLSIEKRIEDKELALVQRKKDLDKFENHLVDQEKEIKSVNSFVMKLDSKLKEREKNLNDVISKSVESELTRRLRVEKKQLDVELKKVSVLNNELKKKIKILDADRLRFKKEHERTSELERKKLTQMQSVYDQKLRELSVERHDFEFSKKAFDERRKQAMDLFSRADTVAKELSEINKIKAEIELNKKDIDTSRSDIEHNRTVIDKEFSEDKELKHAIEGAETELVREKENLDNLIFSKYLENRLKSIKPEYLEKQDDWKTELKSNPLYKQIFACRQALVQHNITEAKVLYNAIRRSYDSLNVTRKEKEALYTALRELYNDIQLKVVESQLNQ